MTRIASGPALLHAALQDIHAGCCDQASRLPDVAADDPGLRQVLKAERAGSTARADRLAAVGLNPAGPANLWMSGVLDDAERDAASTEPGRLLDIALAGAIRKGKAAEVVACDTALALARAQGDQAIEAAVEAIRAEVAAADAALLSVIVRLAG